MKIVGYQIYLRITRFVILVIRPDYQKFCLRSTPACVFCLYIYIYTLLKVVSYYDLSVLSMSVMGFQKKVWMGGGGLGELYPSLFWIFET